MLQAAGALKCQQNKMSKSGRRRKFKEKNIKRVGKMCAKESE